MNYDMFVIIHSTEVKQDVQVQVQLDASATVRRRIRANLPANFICDFSIAKKKRFEARSSQSTLNTVYLDIVHIDNSLPG